MSLLPIMWNGMCLCCNTDTSITVMYFRGQFRVLNLNTSRIKDIPEYQEFGSCTIFGMFEVFFTSIRAIITSWYMILLRSHPFEIF